MDSGYPGDRQNTDFGRSKVVLRASSNSLLRALPDDAFALLEPHLRIVELARGFVCYGQGSIIDEVYFPEDGTISLLVSTGNGNMVETASIGREGALGVQCGLGHRLSFPRALVQIAGKFSIISARRFEQTAAHSGPVRELVHRCIETSWAEAHQLAACRVNHDVSSRLCRLLLQCSDRVGGEHLLMTQGCLAEALGVRRSTVTVLAQKLQNLGLVRCGRGRIMILKRPALQRYACECYEVLQHDHLSLMMGLKL